MKGKACQRLMKCDNVHVNKDSSAETAIHVVAVSNMTHQLDSSSIGPDVLVDPRQS